MTLVAHQREYFRVFSAMYLHFNPLKKDLFDLYKYLVNIITVHAVCQVRIRVYEDKVICVLCGADTPLHIYTHLGETLYFV